MNIPGFTTNGLLMMHSSILQALAVDDNLPNGQEKLYGVREYQDWKQHADDIEKELLTRGAKFQPIVW
ncbi:hypothetical protein [Alcaligenes faecalis]|uniref:Uncharacterized protein n=1 Tax=Alcaligenes faecalis TaxID=511 RepID=A0ABY7N9H4_ALCFA|nr:hypothetical protein [Alcaligenes faecalis]WBM40053.1 hypothetical protein M2J83_09645 [Alcaligenes faecalis]